MRREHLYVQDILEACDMIQVFLEGVGAAAFLASELHKAATLQKLTVIGKAAARLLAQLRVTATPAEFPWVASGYRAAMVRMQDEVLAYLTRHASAPVPAEVA